MTFAFKVTLGIFAALQCGHAEPLAKGLYLLEECVTAYEGPGPGANVLKHEDGEDVYLNPFIRDKRDGTPKRVAIYLVLHEEKDDWLRVQTMDGYGSLLCWIKKFLKDDEGSYDTVSFVTSEKTNLHPLENGICTYLSGDEASSLGSLPMHWRIMFFPWFLCTLLLQYVDEAEFKACYYGYKDSDGYGFGFQDLRARVFSRSTSVMGWLTAVVSVSSYVFCIFGVPWIIYRFFFPAGPSSDGEGGTGSTGPEDPGIRHRLHP